jgi:hypothetical protein
LFDVVTLRHATILSEGTITGYCIQLKYDFYFCSSTEVN